MVKTGMGEDGEIKSLPAPLRQVTHVPTLMVCRHGDYVARFNLDTGQEVSSEPIQCQMYTGGRSYADVKAWLLRLYPQLIAAGSGPST